uniref:Eukaryotic Translation Initiation Factor 4E n=1 Tax=Schistosoma mansoni TaxID=6183 RepID=UPI0001BE658A|nr:Chain A, Eukaryotic Translation Initiation Factor 4E [Schistosoma mansoni]3HXI_A Chain A, Eukaryotic Translation Initiation 4E [Schistosoma mansoni]
GPLGSPEFPHPLQDSWSYYLFQFRKALDWDECLEKVATFSTIEDFWSVLTHTVRPREITYGKDLYMFKSDIMPKWEDPKNENGGRWLINVTARQDVDFLWDELLMLLIGSDWDTDEEDRQICGAVFQPRSRGSKLSVWLTSDNEEETILSIGRRIKERLELEDTIYFQPVSDQRSQTRGSDICTGKYEI